MKKIILFFFVALYSLIGQAQVFTEGFEGAPLTADGSGVWTLTSGNWLVRDNRTNAGQNWKRNTIAFPAYQGTGDCAFVDRENTGQGVLAEEWLITPQITGIPASSQFRFYTRQTLAGDTGTKYQIRVSSAANQDDLGSFTVLKEYTETELSTLTADQLDYEEKIINLTFTGARYFAFVKVFTQPGAATGGDRWLVDNVRIIQRCPEPSNLGAPTITSSTATLTWTAPTGINDFQIIYGPSGFDPDAPTPDVITTPTFTSSSTPRTTQITGLTSGQNYQYYVRSVCPESESVWIGPYLVPVPPLGSLCTDPRPISVLPFQENSNTLGYGNHIAPTGDIPGNTGCGTTNAFLASNDVVYSYTNSAATATLIAISMNPLGSTNTGVFVYGSCGTIGTSCLGGVANTNASIRNLTVNVAAGQTVYIVLSSTTATPNYPYTLIVQQANCVAPINLSVPSFTTTSANLSWVNGTASISTTWEVAVQLEGALIPSGPGVLAVTNTNFPVTAQLDGTPLVAGTKYQYWVRADCGNGLFSPWSGPFFFNTDVCETVNKCNYTFVLSTSTGNGWKGAIMQIKQAGIVVGTVGPTFTNASGPGPVNVTVPLCNALPFDLVWTTAGTNANSVRLLVKNSFDQPIYAITSNSGNQVGNTLLTKMVDCLNPECQKPTAVAVPTATIFTTTATVNWTTSGIPTTGWEIYLVLSGQPAPTDATVPTYFVPGTDPTSFVMGLTVPFGPLTPDTLYDVYVRSVCSVDSPSDWSPVTTFRTIPTCFRPTTVAVTAASINTTSATVTWINGLSTDNHWEVLLIPAVLTPQGPTAPAAPGVVPPSGNGELLFDVTAPGSPFNATGLQPATIYYVYVRTVCSASDSSVWQPATVPSFNTLTCDAAAKCNYKFILSASTGNTWNGGRMLVRQNGITVATLGANQINNAAGVTVALCPGVPYDLYWSVAGTSPDLIGVTVVNPFLDVLYTKLPAQGTPLTVLYSGTGNCTPAPCSKPTGMTAVTTSNSALLTWTDNSDPPSQSFALYVVPAGQPAPTNIPPTPPTVSGIIGTSYDLTLLNGLPLTPSTSYTYYVKAICADPDSSAWTVLTPLTFVTKPVNDECLTATAVPVNPGQACVTTVAGNTFGATASLPVLNPVLSGTGCGQANNDVWYSFVATATSHSINLTNLVGTPAAATLNHSVFSGDCNNLVKLYCSTALNSGATGLTVGNTYYIRVYNSNTTAGQSVTFNICITSPPANDECIGAIDVPVNPDQVCNQQTAGNTLGATASAPTLTGTGCVGSDDDVWFKFTATNAIHMIEIKDLVPTPASANTMTLSHTLFSGSCGTLTNIYCSALSQSVATGLVIGQTYYIRVYTAGTTAGQSATFNVCIKTPPPPATNDECANAIPVAVNLTAVCSLTTPGNIIGATASLPAAATCQGNSNDDVWFSFVATSSTHFISLLNVEGTTTNLNHAVYSGTCGALTLKYCSAANSLTSNNATFVVGQTYYIRVWSNEAASQVSTFNLCVKSISTCENAAPFCGSSPTNPYIFENTTGILSTGQIACLGSNPNPTYYTLHVGQTGPLYFNILQNTAIDAAGNPTGQNLDVDFVAWGPFTSTQACNQIAFADCPTCPFDNFPPTNSTFYPFGNIIDCSYSASFTETLSIPNAQQDEYYIILITNFNGAAGFIKLVQTNFTDADAGETICCGVELGTDKSVCDTTVTLNALEGVVDLGNVPGTYQWFYNGSTTPIAGETGPTIVVNQPGSYKVTGACGLNEVEDTINVAFNVTPTPVIDITQPTCENLLGSIVVTAPVGTTSTLASNLFISEVTDEPSGSTSPSLSYVEIYNGTGAAVDLSNYKLKVYTNGNAGTQCDSALSGMIANNTTVVAKLSTDANIFGITPQLTPLNCTGVNTNDSIVLTTATDAVVDIWGINGTDFTPLNAAGYDYRRNASAIAPSTTWNSGDWTVIDWTTTTTTAADYSNIGSHTSAPVSGYQYNVDNGAWQAGTTFTGLTVGSHTVYVKDLTTTCISSLTFDISPSNVNQPVTTCDYPEMVCISDPNPTNSFGGLTPNGQFSTDSAQLVIDPVTGEVNLAASQPGTYHITYTFAGDLANCIGAGSTTVEIVVTPLTVPAFTQLGPICSGTTAPTFVNTSNNGITGSWNPAIISNTASDTYTFTPDAGQCADVAVMNISVVTENIVSDFTQIPPFCEGTPAPTLSLTSNNGITGIWTPATVSNVATGTYSFTPDAGQCALPATMTIVVTNANIVSDFTQIPPFCEGTPAPTLSLTSNNGITGIWTPATVSNVATGTYNFTPDAGQCALPATMTIVVTNANIVPDFTQIPPFCEGTPAPTLSLTSNNGITGVWTPATVNNLATDTYSFTPDAGQCALPTTMTIVVTPPNITPTFTQIADICSGSTAPSLPTTSIEGISGTWTPNVVDNNNTATYQFTPAGGQCALGQTMTITVNLSKTSDFPQITPICKDDSVPPLATMSPNGITGVWNPAVISNTESGTYIFTPTSDPCASGQTLEVTIVAKPEFSVTGGCIGGNYTLTVSPEIAGATYVWKDDSGNVIVDETSSTLVVSQIGSYTCEVSASGCSDSQTEPVTTISCLIQKGISPKGTGKGDDKNDFFDLEGFNVSKLQIFNRYGTKVYSKSRYVNEWYGQSDNGDELPDGTYFYVIDIDGQKSKSGWIYINHEQ